MARTRRRPGTLRFSLDTNTFLWLLGDPTRLTPDAQDAVTDPANEVFVSVVVIWEIVIKFALGKLRLAGDTARWLPGELSGRDLAPLSVTLEHVLAVEHLPLHHRDPFDRLLVAQARAESLTVVTHDRAFAAYDVPVLWT